MFLSTSAVMPFGQLEHDRVRVAEREVQLLPFDLGAVTDAADLELALEPW